MTPLKSRLIERIRTSGPLSLHDYMAACLTDPDAGYYTTRMALGAAGDFTTAPEISQVFGELIGLWCADLWVRAGAPPRLHLVELGPGRGVLMADALRAAAKVQGFSAAVQAHFVEVSPLLQKEQAARTPGAIGHSDLRGLPQEGPCIFVANEFFDALPVRQLVKTEQAWRERHIDTDGARLYPVTPEHGPSLEALVPNILRSAPPGAIYELCGGREEIERICQTISRQGGAALILDYGHVDHAFGDTFQALQDHVYADPFEAPGEADLTVHVNFAQLAEWAASNVHICGPVTQGAFLRHLGLDLRTAMLAKAHPERAEELVLASRRLADVDQMGALFKAMALRHPDWPPPEGFPEGFKA